MPYTVEVPGRGVVEVPDDVSLEEANREIEKAFPPNGEEVASMLASNPDYVPSIEEFKLFKDYSATRSVDWGEAISEGVGSILKTAETAAVAGAGGAALNPANLLEGFAQGTQQLVDLVSQSQDPNSPLFKFKNYINSSGSIESQRQQFIEARQSAKEADQYARGEKTFLPKELVNPEFVQGVAMVADPTLFFPGLGQVLGAEKIAAKAVGKAVQATGRGLQAVSRPVERAAAAVGQKLTEAIGTSPEAMRGALATSGVLAATGTGPAVGLVGAVPVVAGAATDIGSALEAAGRQLYQAPTRIGALEAVGAIPEANLRQRVIGTIGRYGGDAALNTALVGTTGSLEGAAIGGVLGYLSGGEEGAAAGIGSGGVSGALGSLGARGLQSLTGEQARAARLNDLTTYVDTLAPEKKAAYQSVQERFGTDTAANLMDLESLIKGTRGDIGVEILRGDEFQKRAGVTARGVVPDENAATPRILINVDAMPKVKGDSPIYTLGHELLHALAKTKQFQGDVTGFVETLTGAYVPNPDGTVRLVSEGQYSPAKVEQLFNDYVKQLPEDARANVISANPTASDRAVYVGEELAAEQVGRILSSQKPDAFLRGFGSTRQNFTDMLLLQEASRVGSKIGQLIERTFGITPTDSVLFPEIKNASPALDAALRRLLKARENIDEALLNADYQKSFKIDQKSITDPVAADYAVRGGFAERLPTGEVRLLTNGELLQRETRDVTALKQIIDGLPGAKIDINGEVVGDLSPEQLDAIKGSSVSSQMKQRLEMANRSINEGRALFVEYYPATEKVQDPTSKRWRTKYASRRVTFREVLPYNLLLSKENNSYVRAIDLTQVRKSLQRSIRPDGSVGGLWGNVGEFLGELNAYLSNLDRKENAIPSRNLFGPDKAEFFGSFMNSLEKGGSEFIHSFRLDRMGQMDPSDFRAKFSESAYRKMKDRFMPAGSVGEEQAWKSGAGFTILTSGNKFRLYGPEGKLLGIYDSAEQAQRKANATQTRLQSENDQLQYPARDEVGQTAAAGNRNRAIDRTQGGQEGGQANRQVRQEGDVGARFMPSSLTARDINAIAAEVGGGDVKGGAKAFGAFMRSMRDKGITLRDVIKSYGITLSSIQRQELSVSTIKKNWPDAPFAEGTKVRPEDAFAQLLGTPEGQQYLNAAERGVFDEQAADAVVQKFRSFGFHNKLKEQMKTAVEQFYPKAQEIIDAVNSMPTDQFIDYVRNNFKGISYGKVGFWSGQLGRGDIPTFDSRQGKLVYGKEVPVTKKVLMEQKDRLTQLGIKVPAEYKEFAQTLLHHEVWDRLNQSDTEHGPIKEAMLRFMPSDAEYLSAVEAGDTAKAQELVDQAAKAAGYRPNRLYHGTREQSPFFEFKKQKTAYGYFFTPDKEAAEYYAGKNGRLIEAFVKTSKPANLRNVDSFLSKVPSDFNVWLQDNFGGDVEAFKAWAESGDLYSDNVGKTQNSLMRELQGLGYDSVIFEDAKGGGGVATSYVIFDPSQIKSADPITRDDAGNVIPLSQRFQQGNADIRYMPAPVPDPSIPGAYSMSGYRILPGKTKGKLRVYSPSGSLVGVVGSVDDAQRMIQKKLQ